MVYVEATLHTAANMDESRIVPFLTSMLALTLAMTTMTTGACLHRPPEGWELPSRITTPFQLYTEPPFQA